MSFASMPMALTCAIKMAATASYNAVPSILIVAPIGKTKRVTLGSMSRFSSRLRNVIGSVAELLYQKLRYKLRRGTC